MIKRHFEHRHSLARRLMESAGQRFMFNGVIVDNPDGFDTAICLPFHSDSDEFAEFCEEYATKIPMASLIATGPGEYYIGYDLGGKFNFEDKVSKFEKWGNDFYNALKESGIEFEVCNDNDHELVCVIEPEM